MSKRFLFSALGLAAAITFGGAAASAQATSDKRIPIRKDEKPAAAPAAAVAKTDTIRLPGRVDTLTVPGPTRVVTNTVHDTVTITKMVELPLQKLPDLYWGIGAGAAIPMNSWRNSTKDGPVGQLMVGWFPHDAAFGIRVDGLASFLSHRATDCPNCPDPRIYGGNADLVLRLPLDRTSKLNPVVYFLGGAGIAKITDFLPYLNTDGKIVTAGSNTYLNENGFALSQAAAGDASWFLNVEAGAGLDFNAGPAHMYIESRFSTLGTTNGGSHYWPTIIGFKFY